MEARHCCGTRAHQGARHRGQSDRSFLIDHEGGAAGMVEAVRCPTAVEWSQGAEEEVEGGRGLTLYTGRSIDLEGTFSLDSR